MICSTGVRLLLAALTLAAASSCNQHRPGTYRVRGTVSWQGVPVEKGDMTFLPVDPELRAEGARIKQGRFELRMQPGMRKVKIFASRDLPGQVDAVMQAPLTEPLIPPEYNLNSQLEVKIEPHDDNQLTFDLPLAQ